LLDQNSYDVIFIDYHLTDANGLEILELIQMHPKNGAADTIMVAGEGLAEIAVKALTMGCSDYIVKNSITKESLRRAIINALQKTARKAERRAAYKPRFAGPRGFLHAVACLSGRHPNLSPIEQPEPEGSGQLPPLKPPLRAD